MEVYADNGSGRPDGLATLQLYKDWGLIPETNAIGLFAPVVIVEERSDTIHVEVFTGLTKHKEDKCVYDGKAHIEELPKGEIKYICNLPNGLVCHLCT